MFIGRFYVTLDAKGRLQVPVKHREQLLALAGGRLTLTRHPKKCLLLYPQPEWEKKFAELDSLPHGADAFKLVVMGSASEGEIDGAGRIQIPAALRKAEHLDGELVWVGLGRFVQIWDPQRLAEFEETASAPDQPDVVRNFTF